MTKTKSKYLRLIKKGEYDLVNISLIGFDPSTGKSFEDCSDEWRAELDKVIERSDKLRWWDLWGNLTVRWHLMCLDSHQGLHGVSLG